MCTHSAIQYAYRLYGSGTSTNKHTVNEQSTATHDHKHHHIYHSIQTHTYTLSPPHPPTHRDERSSVVFVRLRETAETKRPMSNSGTMINDQWPYVAHRSPANITDNLMSRKNTRLMACSTKEPSTFNDYPRN